jgi:hypothetical protein
MSTGIDISFIRENYQRMPDDEIIRIATQDAAGLTPEAQEVIKEELTRRKVDPNIIKAVQAQNKTYTIQDIDHYCEIIRKLNCPICGASHAKLNGTMTSEVISYIVFTQHNKKLKIACPACLDKANDSALTISVLAGWWGIPWGFIRTIQAIGHNTRSKKSNHLDTPNDFLRSFTLSKIGQLETYKDNKEMLQQIVSKHGLRV